MAQKKISELSAGAALSGTEVVPAVQSGATVKVLTQQIADLIFNQLVLGISITGSLPNGTVNQAYSSTLTISGGSLPYTLGAYTLPAGLIPSISGSTITVSGTPTTATTADSSIQVNSALGTVTRTVTQIVDGPTIVAAAAESNLTPPVITGTPTQGQSLSTSDGTWTGTPTLTRQWKANGVNISGATSNIYLLTAAEVGDVITVTVTATYAGGPTLTSTSAGTAAVAAASSESNLSLPVISGDAQVGSSLTTTNGTWTNSPTLTRQWKADGVNLTNATGPAYLLTASEQGKVITVTVTAVYAGGPTLTATSAPTAAVAAAPVVEADPAATIFADSTRPDDSGNGLTLGTAKKTISAAMALVTTNSVLGLARGSTWREQISPPVNMKIVAVGSGAAPVLDGADVATGWTRTDIGAFPNRWTLTWVRPGPITGQDSLGLWKNGVRPRQASSFADLASGGGWFVTGGDYFQLSSEVHIDSVTDPNSNGDLYEITRRNNGLNWHSQVAGSGATVNVYGPIEAKRASNHYNAVAGGPGNIRKMLLRDGHVHHIVTAGEFTRDTICTEIRPNLAIPGVPFTAYRAAGAGFAHTFENCMALFPSGAARIPDSNAFLSHATDGNTLIDGVNYLKLVVRGMDGVACASAVQNVVDSYFVDPYTYGITIDGFNTNVTRCQVHETVASLRPGGATGLRNTNVAATVVVTNSVFATKSGAAFTDAIPTTGSVSVANSVFFTPGSSGITNTKCALNYSIIEAEGRSISSAETGFSGDHNVFFSKPGETEPWFHYNGTLYTYNSLRAFATASSSNTNSVYTKPADQTAGNANAFWLGVSSNANTGPAAGDFRINPNARVYSTGGDATPPHVAHIGVFPDGVALTLAGPQQRFDRNSATVVSGPPSTLPILPTTIAEMRTWINDPQAWTY